ncbi:hypothetical protein ElyMa_001205700 [Elysia marginata]|uniref:Autophagy-related protein 13 n=1 Tax=Elysia marginata TaxID=1093978 RepID=A0AAV4I6W8_9GAST|nr:hypothetical protein ElyMa_001205700 [Elysia marginata]
MLEAAQDKALILEIWTLSVRPCGMVSQLAGTAPLALSKCHRKAAAYLTPGELYLKATVIFSPFRRSESANMPWTPSGGEYRHRGLSASSPFVYLNSLAGDACLIRSQVPGTLLKRA